MGPSEKPEVASAVLTITECGGARVQLMPDGRALYHRLKPSGLRNPATPYLMAQVFGILAEKERAFACFEKALDERHFQLVGVKADPALDSLRADCRFTNLVRRMRS